MTQPPEQQPPTPPVPPGGPGGPGPQWPVAPPPQPGPGQYYPPAGPYGAAPYPQPSSGGSGKTIAIIVGVIVLVILLFCGGIIALGVWAANSIENGLDEYDTDREGGSANPIVLDVGEKFEIDGIEYAEGWRIDPPKDEYSGEVISGLTGTNNREDEDAEYVYLTFDFVTDDNLEVGTITCSSGGSISYGRAKVLECHAPDDLDGPYDRIEVSAS